MISTCLFPALALYPTVLGTDSTRYSMRCVCITNPSRHAESGCFLSTMTYSTCVIQAVER